MSYSGLGFGNNGMEARETHLVTRHPASSLLVIDSEDRNISSSSQVATPTIANGVSFYLPEAQPWNNFKIQTPDRLLTGDVTKIMLKGIRFPWAIPNITPLNNYMKITITGGGATPPATLTIPITMPIGFNTPADFVRIINGQILANGAPSAAALSIAWNYTNSSFIWTITGYAGGTFLIEAFNKALNNNGTTPLTYGQYLTNPSLPRTMGMSSTVMFYNINNAPAVPGFPIGDSPEVIVGSRTTLLYTNYVDIVSVRLNQYRTIQDGASKNISRRPLLTRLYCANETSTQEFDISGNPIPIGSQSFLINRKICEKAVPWDPNATLDYLDFTIYDEFGDFVYTPPTAIGTGLNTTYASNSYTTYPSFQMTLLISE